MLQECEDKRSVVQGGIITSHQLQGDVGSISSTAVICEEYAGCSYQTQSRQHDNDVLYQPHGRYTLPSINENDHTDVDMVPRQKDVSISGAPSWQAEPGCGSGIQNAGRQLGMEIESSSLQPLDEAARPLFSGSVCISANSPVTSVYELEARSRSTGDRCPITAVDGHTRICFPSVLTDWKMPDQGTSGEGVTTGADCTNVADTVLVSGAAVDGNQRACEITANSRSVTEPQRRDSSSNSSRITESSRVDSVRKSLNNQRISEGASNLILASWRSNTEQSYSCSWRKWESWCAENGYEAINSPLRGILDFLAFQYQQGKQYRTINSYRSAISMTHTPIEGVVAGKHPLVSRLMKGIYNKRPPQPRYTSTWDVQVVLQHLRGWGNNASLGRKQLSLKLVMLMALANASRCSELHALDIERMRFSERGVTFSLAELTKTSKPGTNKIVLRSCRLRI